MKKFEFLLSLILRVVVLIYGITELIDMSDWGDTWMAIWHFVLTVTMCYSLYAQIYLLYKAPIKDKECEYEW